MVRFGYGGRDKEAFDGMSTKRPGLERRDRQKIRLMPDSNVTMSIVFCLKLRGMCIRDFVQTPSLRRFDRYARYRTASELLSLAPLSMLVKGLAPP